MGLNFGAFAGGLSTGIERGMKLSEFLKKAQDEKRLQEAFDKQAEADRQSTAATAAKESAPEQPASGPIEPPPAVQPAAPVPATNPVRQGIVTSAPLPPIPLQPGVGASSEGNAGEAEAAAANAPSVSTQAPSNPKQTSAVVQPTATATPQSIATTGVIPAQAAPAAPAAPPATTASPQKAFVEKSKRWVQDEYLRQGRPEMAKAYDDYAESVAGKRKLNDVAKVFTAPDYDTAVTRAGEFLNKHGDGDVKFLDHEMITRNGEQMAVVRIKTGGKESKVELTKEQMMSMVSAATDPRKFLEQHQAKQTAAEKLKYEAALKAQERAQKKQDDIELEGVKAKSQRELKVYEQDRLDQREGLKTKGEMDKLGLKFELDAEFEQKYKKATSPTERRALVFDGLTKSDPRFSRLTKEEQSKRVDDAMSVIEKDDKPAAQPGVASKPIGYDPKYKVVYQRGTGKPFHVVDGQYVPIEGAVPPQANGLPKK